jgi:hypothetical protein
VDKNGDDGNDGKSEAGAFATLEKAYEAALLDETGYSTIVVLTDLSKTGLVELSAIVEETVIEKSITIKGGGAKTPTLTRIPNGDTSDKNGRVLKVSGGAKIKFENIIINGITASDYYHGALAIEGAAGSEEPLISRVTLGNKAVITGKKDGIDLDPDYYLFPTEANAGTGIFIGLYGELVMETGSKVTGCAASGGNFAFAPVVAPGGEFTMNGGEISKNIINSKSGYGGGVYVSYYSLYGGSPSYLSGEFTMNGGEISGNKIVCTQGAYGGGVYINGTYNTENVEFTMNGGKISGNTVTGSSAQISKGGGVYVGAYSIFDMTGSEISGNTLTNNDDSNTAVYGGGVYVANTGEFEMTNSLITGNTLIAKFAAYGGGVFLDDLLGKFNMISGEISNNEAYASQTYGGGVCLYVGYGDNIPQFTMKGGVIYGNSSGSKNIAQNGAALCIRNNDIVSYDANITAYPITE